MSLLFLSNFHSVCLEIVSLPSYNDCSSGDSFNRQISTSLTKAMLLEIIPAGKHSDDDSSELEELASATATQNVHNHETKN